MPEELLHVPYVGATTQQVDGDAVAEQVRVNVGHIGRTAAIEAAEQIPHLLLGHASGYTCRRGRPGKDDRPIGPVLMRLFGMSEPTMRRALRVAAQGEKYHMIGLANRPLLGEGGTLGRRSGPGRSHRSGAGTMRGAGPGR
jgi:hypothetical protein